AIFKLDGEKKMLEKMGLDAEIMDSGCCGQAGSFGFEAGKYDFSMQIAHRAMVPKIEESESATLIVANGFSCQTQIVDATDRKPLHLAEVLQMGLEKRR